MTRTTLDKFSDAIKSAGDLPGDTQDLLAEELKVRIAELSEPHMSDEQRAEVKRRLALPRRHVDDSFVAAILKRYNPAL